MLHVFRLFYLNQDTMLTYIKEKNFFICLTWLHPALSGIIVSILLGENFLSHNNTHIFSTTPILLDDIWGSFPFVYKLFGISNFLIVAATSIIQVLLFIRQRQLEKQRADGMMVITYNMDGVTISRRAPDLQSSHKLWKHNRTVVTPKASFFSFLLTLLSTLLHVFGFFSPFLGQLVIFLAFSRFFFLYILIETIFSPTLRNSLSDVFMCHRRAYHVVNV